MKKKHVNNVKKTIILLTIILTTYWTISSASAEVLYWDFENDYVENNGSLTWANTGTDFVTTSHNGTYAINCSDSENDKLTLTSQSWFDSNAHGGVCMWLYQYEAAIYLGKYGVQIPYTAGSYFRWDSWFVDSGWSVTQREWYQVCAFSKYHNATHNTLWWYINGAEDTAADPKYKTGDWEQGSVTVEVCSAQSTMLVDDVLFFTGNDRSSLVTQHYNDAMGNFGTAGGTPPDNAAITITHTTDTLQWHERKPTISFTANETLTSAAWKYEDSTWNNITDLTSPYTFTMDEYASITKWRGLELTIQANTTTDCNNLTINLTYYTPNYQNITGNYTKKYLNSTMIARYKNIANSSTTTELEKRKKAVINHNYQGTGSSYDYSNFSNWYIDDRANDCVASAIMCQYHDNASLGITTQLGNPTYSCDLALHILENTEGADNSNAWTGEMDRRGRAGIRYGECALLMWQKMSNATRNDYANSMFNWSLHAIYKSQQRDSTAAKAMGSSANWESFPRVLENLGWAIAMYPIYNYSVADTYKFCERRWTSDYTGCDGDVSNATDLFTNYKVSTINGSVIFELLGLDYNFGKWANTDDEDAHPDYYSDEGFAWRMMGIQGMPSSGTAYGGGWTHMAVDHAFNLIRDTDTFNPYDWYNQRYLDSVLAWKKNDQDSILHQISSSDNWALANMGVTQAYLDSVLSSRSSITKETMHYYLKAVSDQDSYNRIDNLNSLPSMKYWLLPIINNSFENHSANPSNIQTSNKTSIYETDQFARIGNSRTTGLETIIIGGGVYVDNSGHFQNYNTFTTHYNNVTIISSSGTASSSHLTGTDDTSPGLTNGLTICDPTMDNGENDEDDYYWAGTSQNAYWLEGTCPHNPQNNSDMLTIRFNNKHYSNNITSLEVHNHINDANYKAHDTGGVWHERQYIQDLEHDILIIIDSFNETNTTHNTNNGLLMGNSLSDNPTVDNITDSILHCTNNQCVDIGYAKDVTMRKHQMTGMGYVNDMYKVQTLQESNDQVTMMGYRPNTKAQKSVNITRTASYNAIYLINTTYLYKFNYTNSTAWEYTRWYTNGTYQEGLKENSTGIYYLGSNTTAYDNGSYTPLTPPPTIINTAGDTKTPVIRPLPVGTQITGEGLLQTLLFHIRNDYISFGKYYFNSRIDLSWALHKEGEIYRGIYLYTIIILLLIIGIATYAFRDLGIRIQRTTYNY